MTAHERALAAIEGRRALIAAGGASLGEDVVDLDSTLRRAIEQEGTCDGCAETKALVLAVDLPDSEPWLCRGCADYDNLIVAMHAAFARDTEALAEVLERHRQGPFEGWCNGCRTVWPCPDARAVLSALGVDHE